MKLIERRVTEPFKEIDKYTDDEITAKPEVVEQILRLFKRCPQGKCSKVFPESEAKDFEESGELAKSVGKKLAKIKAAYPDVYAQGFHKVYPEKKLIK